MFRDYYPLGYWYLTQAVLVVVLGVCLTWLLTRKRFSALSRAVRIGLPLLLTLPLLLVEYSGNRQVGEPGSKRPGEDTFTVAGAHYPVLALICLPWLVTIVRALAARARDGRQMRGSREATLRLRPRS